MVVNAVRMGEAVGCSLVLITKKIANVIASTVLAATPLFWNIARRRVFCYSVCQSTV